MPQSCGNAKAGDAKPKVSVVKASERTVRNRVMCGFFLLLKSCIQLEILAVKSKLLKYAFQQGISIDPGGRQGKM
jgi:hypothetical protein